MTQITVSTNPLTTQQGVDCIALLCEQDFAFNGELQKLADAFQPNLQEIFTKKTFTGKALSTVVISGKSEKGMIDLIFIGLGKRNDKGIIDIETYRRALGKLVRSTEGCKDGSAALQLPAADLFGLGEQRLGHETAVILAMAAYHFDEYITDPERKVKELSDVTLVAIGHDVAKVQAGVKEGQIIAQAVNQSRHWIDQPAVQVYPDHLADQAKYIANKRGLKITVFAEKEVRAMGMGGLAAVSAGSDRDCQFVIMEYSCGDVKAPTLGFVGKGITFDSGGLSLKPAVHMETMKEDMSGAAAVISAMDALAQLKPKVNIVAIAPISENLPSGKATKPGDIITFYNGKTAEIKNTDAEGRLILADALSYAVKHYKLDALIDLATLTGSCAHALGPFFTGLMSQHDAFTAQVMAAGDSSGDRVWRLPFSDDYKPAIKSTVADLCNIGSSKYMAGAVTAGFFLQSFVEDVPWVHLDIAGTAFDVPDISYFRPDSGTGVGVRLLVDLAMNWQHAPRA